MTMTSDAKGKLSKTIRGLRERLLTDLHDATDREYRLSVRLRDAKLDEAKTAKRKRLEGWLDEQVRAESGKHKRDHDTFRRDAEKQAAYTLLNRLVLLRILEASEMRKPLVVTGGWNSRGYKDFREIAPALVRSDDSEGYAYLLQLIFEDLATDLPGLYGPAGIADLIPVPSASIRAVVEALDDLALETCWTDDMTLGWVYQYWNDPEREALDAKINDGGKIEPHEIASKTQMFTERYMVDWLLQNSLGPMWLAMCGKHGWTAEAESTGTLDELERRRVEWRAKRDAGEVELTELMPLESDMERRWAYYVPQPIPDDAVEHAPDSVRDLKILDPAVGSGHFLVVAFDLLFALYEEEARHRGVGRTGERSDEVPAESTDDEDAGTALRSVRPTDYTPQAITERILEHNLHGIDLDPRAVQIAAAALWLKAQSVAFRSAKEEGVAFAERKPTIRQLNLVASNLRLGSLPDNDPALVELRETVEQETGIPAALTDTIVHSLAGADHLGSLLKVDAAIEAAIAEHESSLNWDENVKQLNLFPDGRVEQQEFPFPRERVQFNVLAALEDFLSRHTNANELGLRLHGEQLAAGVRFVRLVREGMYDLIVANPPYQGTSKMAAAKYVEDYYALGKADLFAAFLLRGLELASDGGVSAMLTMRNWMFTKQYSGLRTRLLSEFDLRSVGDFAIGAFDEVPNDVLTVAVTVTHRVPPRREWSVAQQPTHPNDSSYDRARTKRKRGATLSHVGCFAFTTASIRRVPECPLVYWWNQEFLDQYADEEVIGDWAPACEGWSGPNNAWPLRLVWEIAKSKLGKNGPWVPYIGGADGLEWVEPLRNAIYWQNSGLFMKVIDGFFLRNEEKYLGGLGVAFTTIGARFGARLHRYESVFGSTGRSLFPSDRAVALCALNTTQTRQAIQDLNPTIHFTVGGVNSLPLVRVPNAHDIHERVESTFGIHESHRETSVEFKEPGQSPWRVAQEWAQRAVDWAEGESLPEYVEELDPEPPTDHLSFAVGAALGRFGANGEGILDPAADDLGEALPHGILFLDGTLDENDHGDSLGHSAAQIIHDKWDAFGSDISSGKKRVSVRDWLRRNFFGDVHRQMYENRPIHWPLSSADRTFVAWVTIHRWTGQTLRILLADHLRPTLTRLDGELDDLRQARNSADAKAARDAEDRYSDVKAWHDELSAFIAHVEQCAEKGPAPPDPRKPERETDARYEPDLDDGVMINSAALWPLLAPQWKDPQKWWKELVAAKGKKDYDWSHLAMRYWPTRVDQKCQTDPSLGVAHGCFWKYHPARAWAWELRLQDEIAPDFRIEEDSYDPFANSIRENATDEATEYDDGDIQHRRTYLDENAEEAFESVEKELKRRIKKHDEPVTEMRLLEWGIWSGVPYRCWSLELATSRTQETDFRLHAPDSDESRDTFLRTQPHNALDIVRTEILVRKPTKKKPLPELRIPDPGLWSVAPAECQKLELEIVKKQKSDFRLAAPDESEARSAWEKANPEDAKKHAAELKKLLPSELPFGDDDSEPKKKRKKAAKKRASRKKAAAPEASK